MNVSTQQLDLFNGVQGRVSLPSEYQPAHSPYLSVSRIFLAKGSGSTPERRQFVDGICRIYPEAELIECPDISHNQIELDETEALALHKEGKRTLVFGEMKSAVRFSEERGNTCPNYWHFSPYGFCPFGCKYCYLAGTPGVKYFPAIKIYVNLPEILKQIDRIAFRFGRETAFYIGKLQDPLALDPLTAYSTSMIPFFARHPYARMRLLTKSDHIERLLELEHGGHTVLSWSVNPPEVCEEFEENTPGIDDRLEAMSKAVSAGYPVRAVMMPVIPVDGWRDIYARFTERLIREIPVQRLTLGGICIYKSARYLMERKLGKRNAISSHITYEEAKGRDGRVRYPPDLRKEIYFHIITTAHRLRPELSIALCLEEWELWKKTGLEDNLGKCNCGL